jgi:uncharacterized protein (AIM24 family)
MSAHPTQASGPYTCPWCNAVSDGTARSCPGCGSPVDVRAARNDGGWYEMPPIKDMARLQVGQSFVQIEGKYVPVADFNLATGDHVYFGHHALLWADTQVKINAMSLKGAWKRVMAGLPIVMTQAHGPGHIAFSEDRPGETIALPLHPGQAVDVREGIFMVATGQVQYDWFATNFWYYTEEGTSYPAGQYMDRFYAPQEPGLVLIHAGGNAFVRRLEAGEEVLVKPPSLLYKDTTVGMSLHIEHPRGYNYVWSRRYVWLRLTGPGRVAIQSQYRHWEDPPRPVQNMSGGATIWDW